jgi:hypothetical protein
MSHLLLRRLWRCATRGSALASLLMPRYNRRSLLPRKRSHAPGPRRLLRPVCPRPALLWHQHPSLWDRGEKR